MGFLSHPDMGFPNPFNQFLSQCHLPPYQPVQPVLIRQPQGLEGGGHDDQWQWPDLLGCICFVYCRYLCILLHLLYMLNKEKIKIYIFSKSWGKKIFCSEEEKLDENKPFDAFISYSHQMIVCCSKLQYGWYLSNYNMSDQIFTEIFLQKWVVKVCCNLPSE